MTSLATHGPRRGAGRLPLCFEPCTPADAHGGLGRCHVSNRRVTPRPAAGAPRWAAVLWGVVLLTTGCVTPGPRLLSKTSPFQAPTSSASMEDAPQRLHWRRGARGLGS